MSIAIQVKELSKLYKLCHEQQGSYSTIVDSLTRQAKKWGKALLGKGGIPKRSYEEFWALDDVSFECRQGDRLGIIGKNGAGKSTLLKILSRIIEPSKGSVKIRGRVASLLEVGTGFHPELSGRENIFLNGAILGMGKTEILKKFDEIVAFSEVEKFLDTPVKYYSSGMYARLGFAIAAHLDPDVLIVDEVLAVGDLQFQKKCLSKMDDVSKAGRTILFVSHNTAATLALCNKGIYLEGGKLKYAGDIEPCIDEYLKTTTKSSFEWTGDLGDHEFRIRSAAFKRTKEFFYQDEEALLEIDCELLKENPMGLFGIEIKNTRKQTIAQAFLNHERHLNALLPKPGKYTLSLPINAKWLWEGEYAVHPVYLNPHHHKEIGESISLKLPVFKPIDSSPGFVGANFEGLNLNTEWKIENKSR